MNLTEFAKLGLPMWVLIFASLVIVVTYLVNKLKAAGVGGFISSTVKDTVDFSQEQKFFQLDGQRQDAIAMLTENAHLTQQQSKLVEKLLDHQIEVERQWHTKHDANYQAVKNSQESSSYIIKQISEKITTLISVVEGLYDRMKSHRGDEIAERDLQIEQQRQYIDSLESQLEMRHDKE